MKKILIPISILFFSYFLFCILTFQKYGNTWDEWFVYSRGKMLYQVLTDRSSEEGKKSFSELSVKHSVNDGSSLYNHLYESVLYGITKEINYDKLHFLNLSFGVVVYLCIYFLTYQYSKKRYLSLLSPLLLFLIYRFSGDLAANPKDGPFAILYFLSIFLIYQTKNLNFFIRSIILGLVFAMCISVRLVGLNLLLILFIFDFWRFFYHLKEKVNLKISQLIILKEFVLFVIITSIICVVLFVTWPYLQTDTINRSVDIFTTISKYPFATPVLFNGKFIVGSELSRWYLPVWFFIATPINIIIFFFVAHALLLKKISNQILFLIFFTFWLNIALYFLIHPVIYDGIRHYLFIYPFVAVISACGVLQLFEIKKSLNLSYISGLVVFFGLIIPVFSFVNLFPYQNLYFNEFVGGLRGAYQRFETDYWGESYKEAVEYLINNSDKNQKYKIYLCGNDSAAYYFMDNMTHVKNYVDADIVVCMTRFDGYKLFLNREVVSVVSRDRVPLSFIFGERKKQL